jgi:hypothetical protein
LRADPAHIEQVIEQPRHLACLALDHLAPGGHVVGQRLGFRICTALQIGASGLRNSCASVAMNSSLRRSIRRSCVRC